MTARMKFYFVEDVMRLTGLSKSKSYQIIQQLNRELEEGGYIAIAGRVPRKKFDERFYCGQAVETDIPSKKSKEKVLRLTKRTA